MSVATNRRIAKWVLAAIFAGIVAVVVWAATR